MNTSNPAQYQQAHYEQARANARTVLALSPSFRTMSLDEQRSLYNSVVNDEMRKLSAPQSASVARAMADGPGAGMGFGGYDPGFDNSVEAFDELVDTVNFPKFVADLLKGVFDANMVVMDKQTKAYIKLMKEATKSVAEFIRNVKPEAAFVKLASENRDQYNIMMEKGADGSSKMVLANPEGQPVDMEDNEVKAKIMDATIALAKEERAAMREVLLMGVTRLVVEKGEIEAGVDFSITAKRHSDKGNSNTNINNFTMNAEYGGGIASWFGGPSGSITETNTNINVSTSNKAADDEMQAKLRGKVNIKFKTDYFKLDNFANMYADGGIQALKQGSAGGTPAAAPAAPGR
ncbi:hypothetical protein ACAW74_13900 [Fibrella sp. WM1]|uniref:hypothetical protein n=1 Tax=Fibrella musci TaxID=3242485 RepID=UPI0035211F1F